MLFGYKNSDRPWIVYVATFPPRECGIATFTEDLMNTFDSLYVPREESKVVAMNRKTRYGYDKKRVIFTIEEQDKESYIQVARQLNEMPNVMIVNIQHEFGIFGGEYGNYIVSFMENLTKPIVLTFHTVLPAPNGLRKQTVEQLGTHADTLVVMTETSKAILSRDYAIDTAKIQVIPHGIHPEPFSDGKKAKTKLGLQGKLVVSTFGLLSKGKGIEYGIEALPDVIKEFPNLEYHILGATHPAVLAEEGETYRESLARKVEKLGLQSHVIFHNKYLALKELLCFLEATDIYMALTTDQDQAVSGTFSYALGAGRPVISTPFAQAREVITSETGILAKFKNPATFQDALLILLREPTRRKEMGRRAYFRTRSWTWHNVALSYMREYIKLAPTLNRIEKNLPKIKLDHILKLTDKFGMLQFAELTTPDPSSGYTVDDNARALLAVTRYYERYKTNKALMLAKVYINFIDYVAQLFGEFYNYVEYNRSIPVEKNTADSLEDARARTLYALAETVASPSLPKELRDKATALYEPSAYSFAPIHPRAIAVFVKSLAIWMRVDPSGENKQKLIFYADALVKMYRKHSVPNWQWFGNSLTYSNAVIPEALAIAYLITKNEECLVVARESMDFLISYSFEGDTCVPIGQKGWFMKGGEKQLHDQQPEEVAVLVQALKTMYELTEEERYKKLMLTAFSWFMGNNTLHQVVYDHVTGGCYDGVGKEQVNLNQGAESTVMYLLARLAAENTMVPQLKQEKTIFKKLADMF